jgi:hypothetical protein
MTALRNSIQVTGLIMNGVAARAVLSVTAGVDISVTDTD